jgi:transcriptional regulator with GAF, ATPase, and Fis domain
MQRFVSAGAPARLLQRVADAAQALTRAERGFVVERQPDGQWVTLASTGDEPAEARRFSRSVVGRALATGRTVSALDALEDTQLNTNASVLGIGMRSVLAAPLRCRGRHLALYVDDRTRPAAFDQESEEVFAACAQLAGLALTASWDAAALRQEQQLLQAAEAALRTDVDAQRDEITSLRRAVVGTERGGMVAGPGPMRRVLELAERAATSAIPVLILGESGTGKELVARFVHDQSARREARFVSENCAAIPDTLLESALFGHERGAFTGADRTRQGLFHSADGGTLFLDEIGEMSPAMQSKLLRVLQNGEVRSVGGSRVTRVDVRLVTATHRDLRAMVAAGQFREDLYYRITVVTLELPPLRERPGDVPLLVRHFLRKHHEGAPPRITPEAMQRLSAHPWPGNVRQLENEVQRLLVMAGDPIDVRDLSVVTSSPTADDLSDATLSGSLALREHVDHLERRLIKAALARTEDNQTRAAIELGVSRYGLQKMMKRLGLRD